jgi:hypothetical protein
MNPSEKSKSAPKNINIGAKSTLPAKAKITETKPQSILHAVRMFGMVNILQY